MILVSCRRAGSQEFFPFGGGDAVEFRPAGADVDRAQLAAFDELEDERFRAVQFAGDFIGGKHGSVAVE